ncbi:LPO_1073/Vpar_1526 family protein [Sphingobacterium anhuiense]|uniref:LPO_1073/Vpar_1526 family protein n=1 Tax=Sphingobacterium anhuiense TaxID=493780 RepID=A0ABW5YY58_9SPHI
MSLVDNLNQESGENSINYQAGKDIVIHKYGLEYKEVKDIVELLFDKNFPKLQEDALKKAEGYVQDFYTEFEERLKEKLDKVDIEKLSDPDIQADLNTAIKSAARKGSKGNLDILAELLSERLEVDTTEIVSMMISEAIKVVPNLNKKHIQFLTFLFGIKHFCFNRDTQAPSLDAGKRFLLRDLELVKEINLTDIQVLEFYGLIRYSEIIMEDLTFEDIRIKYDIFSSISKDTFEQYLRNECPSLYSYLELFKNKAGANIKITPVGKSIAITFFNKVQDYYKAEHERFIY